MSFGLLHNHIGNDIRTHDSPSLSQLPTFSRAASSGGPMEMEEKVISIEPPPAAAAPTRTAPMRLGDGEKIISMEPPFLRPPRRFFKFTLARDYFHENVSCRTRFFQIAPGQGLISKPNNAEASLKTNLSQPPEPKTETTQNNNRPHNEAMTFLRRPRQVDECLSHFHKEEGSAEWRKPLE